MSASPASSSAPRLLPRLGLVLGPLFAALAAWAMPDVYVAVTGDTVAITAAARATTALAVWMAVWWMTEAIPVYATALLPLGLLPLLGAGSAKEAAAPYGNEMIFLFLGGFLMALSMQRWGLDRRIAYGVLRLLGARADRIVLGMMAITAVLSMWVSNTATALTLYSIALSVLSLLGGADEARERRFAHALLLGVAYAASLGGMATIIGTPPNLFLASYVQETLGIELSFARWMLVGVPVAVFAVPAVWWLLLRVFPVRDLRIAGVEGLAREALREMGPLSRGEKATIAAFAVAAAVWIFRPLLADLTIAGVTPFAGLTDSGVAILAALALFMVPAGRETARGANASDVKSSGAVMDWEAAKALPFGLLLLFGGGLSLAAAIERNGVGDLLGAQIGALAGMPLWAFVALAAVVVTFAGELLSNTAMTAALIPLVATAAKVMGWDPMVALLPLTLAASCGFMLPVATPPNAIVYASGRIDARLMIRAGFWANLIGIAVILIVTAVLGRWVV
jgi:solute carrier family 13 (sodium-dependent dicarboxylate transporter), member 2/3/5